jgi:hypothetical protein
MLPAASMVVAHGVAAHELFMRFALNRAPEPEPDPA